MTQRVRDWQSRLATCLAEHMARPFAWGANDCVMFAADCVLATTGVDPAEGVRGTYTSQRGAARVLKQRGGLEVVAAAALGPEVPVLLAQAGDIGLVSNVGQPCLGVCTGAAWLAPGADGLCTFPIADATRVWRLCAPLEST